MRPIRCALFVLATVIVLAACGDADDTGSATEATTSTTEAPVDEPVVVDERDGDTASAAPDDATEAGDGGAATGGTGAAGGSGAGGSSSGDGATSTTSAPETTGAPVGGGVADCIPGTYLLDSAGFVAQIEDLGFDEAGATATWEGGTYTSEFRADGTYTSSRSGWVIRLASPEGALVATFDGDQTGTWSVEGETMSVVETADNSSMAIAAEVDGQVIPMPGTGPGGGEGASISGSGPVTCDDGGMIVTIDGIVTTFERTG